MINQMERAIALCEKFAIASIVIFGVSGAAISAACLVLSVTAATEPEKAGGLPVVHVLAGMLSLPKFGPAYKASFDAIYPTLATRHKISLYPFFLSGVFGDPRLMLSDGEHPNVFGVQRIVAGILPIVKKNLGYGRSRYAMERGSP